MGDEAGSEGRVAGRKNKGDEIESGRGRVRTGQVPVSGRHLEERRAGTQAGIGRRESRSGKKSRVLDRIENVEISKRPSHKKHDNRLNWHVRWPQHEHPLSHHFFFFVTIIYPRHIP